MTKKAAAGPPAPSLYSDAPLGSLDEDQLERAEFAKALAAQIVGAPSDHGFVFGLYGPWGSGKSSILAHVERCLCADDRVGKERVVRFDPWWYSTDEALIVRLLEALAHAVTGDSKLERNLREALRRLAPEFAKAAVAAFSQHHVPGGAHELAELAAVAARSATGGGAAPSGEVQHEHLCTLLEKYQQRIVVLIDDVDRLTNTQVCRLLGLLKTVADLPYVTYVLVYDRDVVVAGLTGVVGDGSAYLDKIVQASVSVPIPPPGSLTQMFIDGLNQRIDVGIPDAEAGRWQSLLYSGLAPLLRSPRRVKLVLNGVIASLPRLVGEVNVADYIALEAVRVCAPPVYDAVAGAPHMYCAEPIEPNDEVFATFHRAVVGRAAIADQQPVEAILGYLFPRIAHLPNHAAPDAAAEVRTLRVCREQSFYTYFLGRVPSGYVSNHDVLEVVANSGSPEECRDALGAVARRGLRDGKGACGALQLLERLVEYVPEIAEAGHCENAIIGVYLGSRVMVTSAAGDAWSVRGCAAGFVDELLRWLVPGRHERTIVAAIGCENDLPLAVRSCAGLARNALNSAQTQTRSAQTVKRQRTYDRVLVRRLQAAAESGELLACDDFSGCLFAWSRLAPSSAREWVARTARDADDLARFVAGLREDLSRRKDATDSDGVLRPASYLPWLQVVVDAVTAKLRRTQTSSEDRFHLRAFLRAAEVAAPPVPQPAPTPVVRRR